MLLFEEISENKFDSLNKEIEWRDQYYPTLIQKYKKTSTENIGLLKSFRTFCKVWFKSRSKFSSSLQELLNQQIVKSYLAHNQLLNGLTMIQLTQNTLRYFNNTISLLQLKKQLADDLQLKVTPSKQEQQKPQPAKKKFLLKRATDKTSSNQQALNLNNDRQKLIQIILSLVEFMHLIFKVQKDNVNITLDQKIQLTISQPKKHQGRFAIKLFHPEIRIPEYVVEILKMNWSSSQQNQTTWKINNHFQLVRELIQKFDQQLDLFQLDYVDNKNKREVQKECLCSTMAMAQFLVNQIGPFNMFFFKCKEAQEEKKEQLNEIIQFEELNAMDQQFSNQVKFYVYEDLKEVIDDINNQKDEPEFRFLLQKRGSKTKHVKDQKRNDTLRKTCHNVKQFNSTKLIMDRKTISFNPKVQIGK